MERQWNIWVSCVSRAPSSCRDTVEEFLTPTKQKVALVCGDFNINLLSSPRLDATEVVFPSAAPPSVDRKMSCPVRSNNVFAVFHCGGGGQDGLSARRWEEPQFPEDERTLPMFCWMCRRATGA